MPLYRVAPHVTNIAQGMTAYPVLGGVVDLPAASDAHWLAGLFETGTLLERLEVQPMPEASAPEAELIAAAPAEDAPEVGAIDLRDGVNPAEAALAGKTLRRKRAVK